MKAVVQRVRPCSLDAATQKLITNIFSKDVFQNAMALVNLGEESGAGRVAGAWGWQGCGTVSSLSPPPRCEEDATREVEQAADRPGFEALEEVEAALKAPADSGRSLEELSSHFYTIIPHNFGRSRPPPINSPELLQAKKDMLLVRAGRLQSRQTGGWGTERWTVTSRPKDRGGEGQADRRDAAE